MGHLDAQKFQYLHFAPRGKRRFLLKNYISIAWHNIIFLFCNDIPLDQGVILHFVHIFESPLPKDTVPSLVEIGRVVLEKNVKDFYHTLSTYFHYALCGYYLTLENA